MIRAGALYYSIFITFVITLITGSLMLIVRNSSMLADIRGLTMQAAYNARDGITVALDRELTSGQYPATIDLYNNPGSIDDVEVNSFLWGAYRVMTSRVSWGNGEQTEVALTGADPEQYEPLAIYLADEKRYLSLCGKTVITGTCYLPATGVRKANIEGQVFRGNKLVEGLIKTSTSSLPKLNEDVIDGIVSCFAPAQEGSGVTFENFIRDLKDSLSVSFYDSTLVVYSNSPVVLENIYLSGNISIVSTGAVRIRKSALLDNITIYASSVYIDDDFTGCLQAFASDTLLTGSDCTFNYPSGLAVVNTGINNITLEIGEGSSLAGYLLAYQEKRAQKPALIKTGNGTEIHGLVCSTGNADHRGVLKGTIICDGFSLRTGSSLYENHLLNAVIDRSRLSEYYSFPYLLDEYKKGEIITWLN